MARRMTSRRTLSTRVLPPDPDMIASFSEFVKGTIETGGVTIGVNMTVWYMSRLKTNAEKLWFLGLYTLVYEWPMVEILYQELPYDRAWLDANIDSWMEKNLSRTSWSNMRRDISGPRRFKEALLSMYDLCAYMERTMSDGTYPRTFDDLRKKFDKHTKHFGRYIFSRWAEALYQAYRVPGWNPPDILPNGGHEPRSGLALIFPANAEPLRKGNDPVTIKLVNDHVAYLSRHVADQGTPINMYEMQVVLCSWKRVQKGYLHYHGVGADVDLELFEQVYKRWPEYDRNATAMWDGRAAVLPEVCRGELHGWSGIRYELDILLEDTGIRWSDAVYDWDASKSDLNHPVKR